MSFVKVVLSLICAFSGVVAGMLGLQCIAVMQGSKHKVWTGRGGGILMILAGNIKKIRCFNSTLAVHYPNQV